MALQEIQRSVTKLGISLPKHSQISDPKEFWPWVVDGSTVPGWPSAQYPLLMYSSSDHSSGAGGVFLRVYDTSAGTFPAAAGWVEWQTISGRAEFSHITQKTNPIYVDSTIGSSTETPTVNIIDGVVYLTTHNFGTDMGYQRVVQNTALATGSNGVDFERHGIILTYDPAQYAGDGHTGYFRWGINTIEEIPYKFIGTSSHGGGAPERGGMQQIVVSNDAYNWEVYRLMGKTKGRMSAYNPATPAAGDWFWALTQVHNAKRDGNYYRVLGMVKDRSGYGYALGYGRQVEFLIDSNFNFIAEPEIIVDLGGSGALDEADTLNYVEFEYDNSTYGVYRALDASETSTMAFCSVSDVSGTWNDKLFFSNETQEVSIKTTGLLLDSSAYTQVSGTSTASRSISGLEHRLNIDDASNWTEISSADSFNMSSYDIIDFDIKNMRQTLVSDLFTFVGLAVDTYFTTDGQIFFIRESWTDESASTARSIPAEFVYRTASGGAATTITDEGIYFGKSPNWASTNDESIYARKNIGVRIIKPLNLAILKYGVAEMEAVDITGFDYSTSLIAVVRCRNRVNGEQVANQLAFEEITVRGYTNVENTENLSTLSSTVTGIPDGSYRVKLYKESDPIKTKPVFDDVVTYTSGSATIENVRVSVGESVQGRIVDNENPHVNGAVITGVTS